MKRTICKIKVTKYDERNDDMIKIITDTINKELSEGIYKDCDYTINKNARNTKIKIIESRDETILDKIKSQIIQNSKSVLYTVSNKDLEDENKTPIKYTLLAKYYMFETIKTIYEYLNMNSHNHIIIKHKSDSDSFSSVWYHDIDTTTAYDINDHITKLISVILDSAVNAYDEILNNIYIYKYNEQTDNLIEVCVINGEEIRKLIDNKDILTPTSDPDHRYPDEFITLNKITMNLDSYYRDPSIFNSKYKKRWIKDKYIKFTKDHLVDIVNTLYDYNKLYYKHIIATHSDDDCGNCSLYYNIATNSEDNPYQNIIEFVSAIVHYMVFAYDDTINDTHFYMYNSNTNDFIDVATIDGSMVQKYFDDDDEDNHAEIGAKFVESLFF